MLSADAVSAAAKLHVRHFVSPFLFLQWKRALFLPTPRVKKWTKEKAKESARTFPVTISAALRRNCARTASLVPPLPIVIIFVTPRK
ncbi:hypothetical protein [Duodenibacillus massiliensis]|uniref:hypothetical protein n=1 Tax=Duodenibacillus massiliensis TaxID=1852381 RepID=UPI003F81873B